MTMNSPLWGAELDHIRLDSGNPGALAAFYRDAFAMADDSLDDGSRLLRGPDRRLIIGAGTAGEQPYSAFRFPDSGRLQAFKNHLTAQGVNLMPSPTPLFGQDAFAVADPDGRQMVFGLPSPAHQTGDSGPQGHPPGRLQHVVVATADLAPMMAFYEDTLSFVATDHVLRDEDDGSQTLTAIFYRSTPEHHSFAMFLSDAPRPDHHAYEVSCWKISAIGPIICPICISNYGGVPAVMARATTCSSWSRTRTATKWKSPPSWRTWTTAPRHGNGPTRSAPSISGVPAGCGPKAFLNRKCSDS